MLTFNISNNYVCPKKFKFNILLHLKLTLSLITCKQSNTCIENFLQHLQQGWKPPLEKSSKEIFWIFERWICHFYIHEYNCCIQEVCNPKTSFPLMKPMWCLNWWRDNWFNSIVIAKNGGHKDKYILNPNATSNMNIVSPFCQLLWNFINHLGFALLCTTNDN